MEAGEYFVIVSTFKPQQIGGFKLTLYSTDRLGFTKLQ